MKIVNAKYVMSAAAVTDCPQHNLPEYAFIGRSNVGKSSLINRLAGHAGLAKTSSKPGKTVTVNFFLVNSQAGNKKSEQWYLVDLPGYGFARAGAAQREQLRQRIEQYCLKRAQLVTLFVLLDVRLKPQAIDMEFMHWLGTNGVPFAIVFTKADKLGNDTVNRNVEDYKKELLRDWEELPPVFVTSSLTGRGAEMVIDYIGELNDMLTKEQQ